MNSRFKDYETIFLIEKALGVNRVISFIKRIPIIKKLFKGNDYSRPVLKAFVSVYIFFADIIKNIFYKALYAAMIAGCTYMILDFSGDSSIKAFSASGPEICILIYLISTLIGTITNNTLFDTDNDKSSVVFLMRMDAKKNVLMNYAGTMIKHFFGHFIIGVVFVVWSGYNPVLIILMPLYGIGAKLAAQALQIKIWEKKRDFSKMFMFGGYGVLGIFVMLALLVLALSFKVSLPVDFIIAFMAIVTVVGFVAGIKVLNSYDEYKLAYKKMCVKSFEELQKTTKEVNKQSSKDAISMEEGDDGSELSAGDGLKGFNNLFMKRHKKILWRKVKIIIIVISLLYAFAYAGIIISGIVNGKTPGFSDGSITKIIFSMVFICYFINGGESITSAMYINCDHSMLTYSFYKQPKRILELFRLRLLSITKLNIIPGIIIGAGFAGIIALTGGQHSYIMYIAAVSAPIVISIFFSVHYLTIYYLLQPYNSESDVKSPVYTGINFITYFISYTIMQLDIEGIVFVGILVAFCIIYIIAACVLVYMFAPKTFRIHK